MVATSRRPHTTHFTADKSELPTTARELFDALPPLPGLRTEVIEGTLIVSPLGSPEHSWRAMDLHDALAPIRKKNGWRGSVSGVDVCIEGPCEPVEPDYALYPPDCPRWGTTELLSTGLVMVAEVVSPGSLARDRSEKPTVYAVGQVPIYLLIDPLATPPSVTVFSDIDDGAYRTITTVAMGTTLMLPAPVDFELDTSIFKG